MITALLTAAIAQAAAPAAAPTPIAPVAVAIPGRGLRDVPNVAISYFDVPGKKGAAIQKSLQKILTDPATKDSVKLFSYDVAASVNKRTVGTKCTVQNVAAKLTSNVKLPRLAEEAKVDKPTLAIWTAYVAKLEADAAANLWFVTDRLRTIEKSMIGADCSAVAPMWKAAMQKLQADQTAFSAARAPAPVAATAAPAKKN